MSFAPPFEKMTLTIYDFPHAVFQNSKYLAMLRIFVNQFTKEIKAIGAELAVQLELSKGGTLSKGGLVIVED